MKPILFIAILWSGFLRVSGQTKNDVFVDKQGLMRWGKSKEEVSGFGVNYTVPFAHAYRTAKKNNLNIEKIIDADVYHFARLGFDAYRVHVWDTEISDTLGNLLINDHLRLFDYLLFKLKERGIKSFITPIAFWGNGWPEPDEKTPGFSAKYGKGACLTNADAIKAQENYLTQFLNHVNEYTGVAYKDDPDIIAFEVSNEPHHGESPEKVTAFIKKMIAAMRKSGTKKPIFYNISHSIHLAEAYFDAGIQGGTFQWYPTGLGARHELEGNVLPHVEKYQIPFAENPKFKKIAKVVYEFDAADVGRSYIYPAMARSFREAGMQWATHFAYDPTYMASTNTEYGTHYMNLAYAPQKAISLMLAGEVFHSVPLYKNYGRYPTNTSFDGFSVSYENDLAELVTDKKFIYSNSTSSALPAADKLEQVTGTGNSTVVKYEGSGAYFLDKIEPGVWRLEIMPDAIWIADPFTRTSPSKELAVINYRTWPIEVSLPDLGENFTIQPLNDGNTLKTSVSGRSFSIRPGAYLLQKGGSHAQLTGNDRWKNISLKEYSAPSQSLKQTQVLHKPIGEATAGNAVVISATIVTPELPEWVEVSVWGNTRGDKIKMERIRGYEYAAIVPQDLLLPGVLKYFITVFEKGKKTTFPQNVPVATSDWDFYDDASYSLRVVAAGSPVYLYNAATDNEGVIRQWTRGSGLIPFAEPGKAELQVRVEKLHAPDPENRNGEKIYDFSFLYPFAKKIIGRKPDLLASKQLILRGRSLNESETKIQVSLVMKNGSAFGSVLSLDSKMGDHAVSLNQLRKVKLATLPRPYPTFLNYYFDSDYMGAFDWNQVESIQFSIGPGQSETELELHQGIAIESVRVE
jgi:hypothetical protein